MFETFDPKRHLVSFSGPPLETVSDGEGGHLAGILGLSGPAAQLEGGDAIGMDMIQMSKGTAFESHVHPGAHILFICEGHGHVVIDGVAHRIAKADSIYIPARYVHAVAADPDSSLTFLAFGVPHLPVSSADRMTLVRDEPAVPL